MLAEWKLSGWQAMCGEAPQPDDLILPLPPDELKKRRTRSGEAIRVGDWAARRWRDVDLKMLGWRHRRMYDGKATMITLAIDDGADETLIRERVTHARPVKNAFDHYYRGTKWLRTCEELSKLALVRVRVAGDNVIAMRLPIAANGGTPRDHDRDRVELGQVLVKSTKSSAVSSSSESGRRDSNRARE